MHFHPKWDGSLRPASAGGGSSRGPGHGRFAPAAGHIPRDDARATATDRLGAERVAQLRQRLREGYYASAVVADQLARQLLACGAL